MRDLMSLVVRRILRQLRRDETGAIGVVVAVLIGGGVVTGMAALVLDVGQLYQERAELQDGADAAALGVAKSCALGNCASGVVAQVAAQLADANASNLTGGTEAVDLVCGSGSLGNCPAPTGSMASCPQAPSGGVNFVEVYTSTETASGSTLLPPLLARTLLGGSGYQGTDVGACAQAVWGAPSNATPVALTISACEWDQETQQGTLFQASPPPYPPNPLPPATADDQLQLSDGNNGTCTTEPNGADGPGSFGWAADQTGNCSLPVTGPTFPASAAPFPAPVSIACQQALQTAQQNRTPILVPVYVSLNSGSGNYLLKGFADFVVTGYNMPGFFASDWLDQANNNCSVATASCLDGYFVQGLIPSVGSLSGTNLGASVIELTG
jgi:Flp pilus assembly protein TadG